MRRLDRTRALFLTVLASISTVGCAVPQRYRRVQTIARASTTDRIAAKEPGNQESVIDGNLLESSSLERGTEVITVGNRQPGLIASTAAYRIPTVEIAPDPATFETQSPSDLELPMPVSIPIAEPSAVDASSPQSVDYYVNLALAGHPSIQAARHRVSAEINRIPQARALPDPMFNNVFWPIQDQALQTAAGRVGNQMSLTQGVPWPQKLKTKAAIVSQEVQIAQAEVEEIEREITESVRLAYYELWFATRAITITEEILELVSDATQVAEARYRSGGTQQDVLRARLEADRLEEQHVALRKQKRMAQADLAHSFSNRCL